MSGLLSIPNELLIEVFEANPTVQAAMRLSSVNKQLRAIWLDATDQIVDNILKSTVPAAEDAIDLAITETRLRTSFSSEARPPLRLWLLTLMRNADLCASAYGACAAHTIPPNAVSKTPMKFHSSPASYYFLQRVLLAFEFPQLRDELRTQILAASEDTREEHFRFEWFLVSYCTKEEAIRQGVPLHVRFPGPEDNGDDKEFHDDAWSYMRNVIEEARGPVVDNDLRLAIENYVT